MNRNLSSFVDRASTLEQYTKELNYSYFVPPKIYEWLDQFIIFSFFKVFFLCKFWDKNEKKENWGSEINSFFHHSYRLQSCLRIVSFLLGILLHYWNRCEWWVSIIKFRTPLPATDGYIKFNPPEISNSHKLRSKTKYP